MSERLARFMWLNVKALCLVLVAILSGVTAVYAAYSYTEGLDIGNNSSGAVANHIQFTNQTGQIVFGVPNSLPTDVTSRILFTGQNDWIQMREGNDRVILGNGYDLVDFAPGDGAIVFGSDWSVSPNSDPVPDAKGWLKYFEEDTQSNTPPAVELGSTGDVVITIGGS